MSLTVLLHWGPPGAAIESLAAALDADPALHPLALEDARQVDLPLDTGACAAAQTQAQARLQRLLDGAAVILVQAPAVAGGLPGRVVHVLQQLAHQRALRVLAWIGSGPSREQSPAFGQLRSIGQALGARVLRAASADADTLRALHAALSCGSAMAPMPDAPTAARATPSPIDLSVGELSVAPDAALVHAVARAASRPSRHAPHGGDPELRQALLEHERRCGTEMDSIEQVLVTTGASAGLAAALDACCPPNCGVLVPDPGFPLYWRSVARAGRHAIPYPLVAGTGQPDMQALARLAPQARAIIWNFPHNPLGTLARPESLDGLATIARRCDLLVLSDETLAGFVWRGVQRSPWDGPLRERTVVLNSFSKSAALGGYRVGWTLCPAPLAAPLMKAHWALTMSTAETAQAAALAALAQWEAQLARLRGIAAASLDVALTLLAGGGFTAAPPDAGLSLWLRLPGEHADDEAFVRRLRATEQLKLRPGAHFGQAGRGHVRLCFAAQPELMKEGMMRLLRFYRSWQP